MAFSWAELKQRAIVKKQERVALQIKKAAKDFDSVSDDFKLQYASAISTYVQTGKMDAVMKKIKDDVLKQQQRYVERMNKRV